MGRFVIFTDDPGWHGKQLRLALAARGFSAEYVSLTECRLHCGSQLLPISIPGFAHALPQAAFVRGVPGGSLEEVVFYLDILHALELSGVTVYNHGRAIEASVDKAMTSFLLSRAGLPTPPTWVVRDRAEALAIAEAELKNGHMLVSKPLFGSQGEGIRRIEKMTDLFWLTSSHGIYYLQRFMHSENGYADTRVFVINGQAVAGMLRRGRCWLNNVARGADCQTIVLEEELQSLAIQATAALNMDYAGIDIIKDREQGYQIIEVNSIPAWKGLQSVCQTNIADYLIQDLLLRCTPQFCDERSADAS